MPQRILDWLRWQRVPVARIRIRNARRETVELLAFALVYVACSAVTGIVIKAWPAPILGAVSFTTDVWYSFAFKLLGLLILPLVWLHRRGYRPGDVFVDERPRQRTVFLAYVGFMLGLLLNAGHISRIMRASAHLPIGTLAPRIGIAVLLPLFTAGLPEEIVYRGLLQTRLEATTPAPVAILGSALLFTAWHLPSRYLLANGVEGRAGDLHSVVLGTGVPVFIVGLVFGVLWYRYRRLVPLIAAHWGIDLLPTLSSLSGIRF
jgi:membrane protease YdiL (CAAX protease family)